MTIAASPVRAELDNLHALIEEARRRTRARRHRYAVGVAVAVAALAGFGAYFGFIHDGGSGGSTATRASASDIFRPASRVQVKNGSLTLIDGAGISALSSRGELRRIFSCSECFDYQSFAWAGDGRTLAFSVTPIGPGSAGSTAYGVHVVNLATNADRLLRYAPGALDASDIAWSPSRFGAVDLAYVSGLTIYLVRDDGSAYTPLRTGTEGSDTSPSWSADGTRIAYETKRSDGSSAIYTIGSDGSGRQLLVSNGLAPAWSPDGHVIAYRAPGCGIKLITAFGFDVTPSPVGRWSSRRCLGLTGNPVWSPDGTKIAFSHYGPAIFAASGTYVIRADGTHLTRVSDQTGRGYRHGRPAWRPVPLRQEVR